VGRNLRRERMSFKAIYNVGINGERNEVRDVFEISCFIH